MDRLRFKYLIGVLFLIYACTSRPKVIEPQKSTSAPHNQIQSTLSNEEMDHGVHKVTVEDFMHTSKYTYLNVLENEDSYWIAVPRMEVEKGSTYYFQGGLKMNNFESKEHNRTFETLLLVSHFSDEPIPTLNKPIHPSNMESEQRSLPEGYKIEKIDGGVTIKELFANRSKYDGQKVVVKGLCTKVNREIMDRNWVHLDDGSMEKADLTVTTSENISVGSIATFEGVISLDKDFGAGYTYEIIMEDAVILKGT